MCIGLSPLPASHTALVCRKAYENVLTKMQIDESRVMHIVTDRGSNLLAAVKDLVTVSTIAIACKNSATTKEIEAENDLNEEMSDNNYDEPEIIIAGKQLSCVAHRISNILMSSIDGSQDVKNIVENVQNVCAFMFPHVYFFIFRLSKSFRCPTNERKH